MRTFFNFKRKPVVHLYTICWNEEYMLKYFFRYYDHLVDRYIFFDDGSTDRTLEILEKHPKVEIRQLPRPADVDSYVIAAQRVHNSCWKESRGAADWVIITAVDEILYAPNLKSYLAASAWKGVTAIPALGYQMLSLTRPVADGNLPDLIRTGAPAMQMNKLSIFNPNKITETGQGLGRHLARPEGDVRYPAKDRLLLLHYHYISLEHTFNRHRELQAKLGSVDRQNGWGVHYGWTMEELKADWSRMEKESVPDLFARGYDPDAQHSPRAERWWRKQAA